NRRIRARHENVKEPAEHAGDRERVGAVHGDGGRRAGARARAGPGPGDALHRAVGRARVQHRHARVGAGTGAGPERLAQRAGEAQPPPGRDYAEPARARAGAALNSAISSASGSGRSIIENVLAPGTTSSRASGSAATNRSPSSSGKNASSADQATKAGLANSGRRAPAATVGSRWSEAVNRRRSSRPRLSVRAGSIHSLAS